MSGFSIFTACNGTMATGVVGHAGYAQPSARKMVELDGLTSSPEVKGTEKNDFMAVT